MSDTSDLDRVIIDNLLDLDDTAKRIEELSDRVWAEICESMESWASKNDWKGDYDVDDPWLTPADWFTDEEPDAFFYVDKGPVGTTAPPTYWLSHCIEVGHGQLCLWFVQKVTGAKQWKALARSYASRFAEKGFSLSDYGNFYTSCSLNAKDVAAALEGQRLETAMTPIEQALDRAASAMVLFNQILAEARTK